jgi:hypothetical protein
VSAGSQSNETLSPEKSVSQALDELHDWIVARGPAGSDPYDALNSPIARLVAPLGRAGRIAFLQCVRRSPVDLRGILRIRPSINPKGLAVLAEANLELFELRGESRYLETAQEHLAWLERHAVAWGNGIGWGYPFDWAARAFFVPRGTPSVVVSSVAGQAFLRAARLTGQARYREVARAVARFVSSGLRRTESDRGLCFSYTPLDDSQVFNASLMGAGLLARVGFEDDDPNAIDIAHRATTFVLNQQNPDGSWAYGLAPFHRWIDGQHTGFILRDLAGIAETTGWKEVAPAIDRGLAFYLDRMIAADGRPIFRVDRPWPADIHACAEALLALSDPRLSERIEGLTERALRVADWTLRHLRRPDGAFGYLRYPNRVDWTAHMRWGQAWMLWGLSRLARALATR